MACKGALLVGCLLTVLLLPEGSIWAQEKEAASGQAMEISEMSLEELLNVSVSVATKKEQTPRESPAIITLVTREDIQAAGARDLVDVLHLIPGFHFGQDVKGVVGLGMRGIWGHEGKVLLLWDGQEMHEDLFATLQLGSHYPVDLIDRIEVLRGPGSAVYGGNAELAVINIISTASRVQSGARISLTHGWTSEGAFRKAGSAALNRKGKHLSLDLAVSGTQAGRSDQIMTDYYAVNPNHAYVMKNQSDLSDLFLSLGFSHDSGLKGRLLLDNYQVQDRTMYGANRDRAVPIGFHTTILDLSWDRKLNEHLTLMPRFTYKMNRSWSCLEPDQPAPYAQDKWSQRWTGSLALRVQSLHWLDALGGVELYGNTGHAGALTWFSRDPGKKELSFTNLSAFVQGTVKSPVADITLGLRWEHNSEAGNSVVPRLALTKVMGKWHAKLLASGAFRSPCIENISRYATDPIKPEKTTVLEVETGYRLTRNLMMTVNGYWIRINDPIVYFVDPHLQVGAYHNGDQTGSYGVEWDCRFKQGPVSAAVSWSLYHANKNQVPDYVVRGEDGLMLGFPGNKATALLSWKMVRGLSLSFSGVWMSKRYGDDPVLGVSFEEDPALIANVFLTAKDLLAEGVSVSLGVHDLGKSGYTFLQPYNGGSAPLPSAGREFLLKVTCAL